MSANLETLSQLERRLTIAIPFGEIEAQVQARLKQKARTAKVQGFRPGKAPLKIIEQQYGYQTRDEVLNTAVNQGFFKEVQAHNLRVAGYPKFEAVPAAEAATDSIAFKATFEVYPEVAIASLANTVLQKPVLTVGDAEVNKTLDILRKQRTRYTYVERAAAEGDRVIIDFVGVMDGVAFDGGSAQNQAFVLGQGQFLAEFEANTVGLSAGESKTFDLTFPEDYHGKDVAGKTAQFTITLKEVAEAKLPEVDADFAKMLGIVDGDVEKMLAEVKVNVEREAERRLKARTKEQVMQALLDVSTLELPKALVQEEVARLAEQTKQQFAERGMDVTKMPFPEGAFTEQAKRRVSLGLIISELVKAQSLEAKPEQIKALVENIAASYEQPEDVVRWYYADPSRLNAPEAVAIEDNVVAWVLSNAKVEDQAISFDELMEYK